MKTFTKFAVAAVMAGAVALAAASPSEARDGRNAAIIGFGAGAVVGAAAANSYNNGYYADRGYYADPGYAYDSGYAYEPAPMYVEPAPTYYQSRPYRGTRGGCGSSPGSMNGGQALRMDGA